MNVQIFLLIIFSGMYFCKKPIKSSKIRKSNKYIKPNKDIKPIKPWTYIGKTQEELKKAYYCVNYDMWNKYTETYPKSREVMVAVLKVKLYLYSTYYE